MDGKLRNMATVYLRKGDRMLLLYRQGGRVVNNVWTGSAGGHFEQNELNDAKACVLREMKEELGLSPGDVAGLSLRYITLRYTKGEIRQNYYFFAELKASADENLISNEGHCQWFSLTETEKLDMPFSARHMMDHYLTAGQYTDAVYVGTDSPKEMFFSELREF